MASADIRDKQLRSPMGPANIGEYPDAMALCRLAGEIHIRYLDDDIGGSRRLPVIELQRPKRRQQWYSAATLIVPAFAQPEAQFRQKGTNTI